MKRLIIILLAMVLLAGVAWGQSGTLTDNDDLLFEVSEEPIHTLSLRDDGTIELDGQPIDRLSDPEIKAILREIADSLKRQTENNDHIIYLNRQTGYLLRELEKCLNSK